MSTFESPILALQKQELEKIEIGQDILKNARNELYIAMRFLDVALSSLKPIPDENAVTMGTDGEGLYFQNTWLLKAFMAGRITVNRLYLHQVLHCLFCHIWNCKDRVKEIWNLAADIAVEAVIDDLYYPSVYRRPGTFRREAYRYFQSRQKVLTAEGIYKCLLSREKEPKWYIQLEMEFRVDDHGRWFLKEKKSGMPDQQKKWEELREKMQTEMETLQKEAAQDALSLLEKIQVENRNRYDYKSFLRKFSVLREELETDTDSFDYIFYHYGMELYGNMPLIEPLETKEIQKIEDFVIVIDTSMSCKGHLVKKFLEETYSVLSESESFFRKINVHIIQCDDRIQEDVVIRNQQEMEQYLRNFAIKGFGGTDFRPPFHYVEELRMKGAFTKLKGLLYFTDGYGLFPVKMPPFDTAFVFMKEDYQDVDVPPWAIKLIIDANKIEEGESLSYEY